MTAAQFRTEEGGNQRRSMAIDFNQWQSETVNGNQEAIRDGQWQSRGNQEAIRDGQWQSRGNPLQSMAIKPNGLSGRQLQSLAISCNQ